MSRFKSILSAILVLILARSLAFSDTDTLRLWQTRAQSITNKLRVDLSKLGSTERALGYAKLGDAWWKTDAEIGREWFTRSIDYGTSPSTAFKDNRERLALLRDLLVMVASRDPALAKKLAPKLFEAGEELSEKDDEANNEAILKAASALVPVDANQAFVLGTIPLKSKRPTFSFSSVVFTLRLGSKNNDLGNQYLAMAIDLGRTRPVPRIYQNLIRIGFPDVTQDQYSTFANESNLIKLLDAAALQFAQESAEALEGRRADCDLTSLFAPRLQAHYESLLPQKLALINQAIAVCQAKRPSEAEKVQDRDVMPSTIDDSLKAAEQTTDLEKKADFLLHASLLAISAKKYQLAFESLLTIHDQYRSKSNGVWEAMLMQSATPLIVEHIQASELAAATAAFARIPTPNRPLIRVEVAHRLNKDAFKLLRKEILDLARKDIVRAEFKPPKKVQVLLSSPELYCTIVNLYKKLGFDSDAIETHEEAVIAVNRYLATVPDESKSEIISALPIGWTRFSTFEANFLDTYFLRLEDSFSKIEYGPVRRDIEFNWLKTTLKRLGQIEEEIKKKKAKDAMLSKPA